MYDALKNNNILTTREVKQIEAAPEKPDIISALYPVITPEEEDFIDKQVEFFRILLDRKSIHQELRIPEVVS